MVLPSHEVASGEVPADDPTSTDPQRYRVLFENDRVRVLEYLDHPGDRTNTHRHPDSVMVTLSGFRRRVSAGGHEVEIELPAAQARWLDAQVHAGENIGVTDTHTIFVELKEPNPAMTSTVESRLGPSPR